MSLSFADIRAAAERIAPYVRRTPVLECQELDRLTGARLFLKCENFQRTGSFKFRGACNAVLALDGTEMARGVATHSSGNHAAALARAAALRGARAWVVMPHNANAVKRAAVLEAGAEIVACEPTMASRQATLAAVAARTHANVIHPYEDFRVMAGQGTAALELLEEHPDLDLILVPVGGGGLLAGTATAVRELCPRARIVGVEPARADDARRAFQTGRIEPVALPDTVADGLRATVGENTLPIIRRLVDDIVTVEEAAIITAMRHVWSMAKIVIEPSSAVPFAALFERKVDARALRVGVIISGGNVDLDALPW